MRRIRWEEKIKQLFLRRKYEASLIFCGNLFACDTRWQARLQHLRTSEKRQNRESQRTSLWLDGRRDPRAETIRNLETILFFVSVWGVSVFVIVSIKDEEERRRQPMKRIVTFPVMEPSLPPTLSLAPSPESNLNASFLSKLRSKTCWCLCAREKTPVGETTKDF